MKKLLRNLKVGDSGEDVKNVQESLNKIGLFPYLCDGNFSQNLLQAITHFQKIKGIYVDGEVGHQTWSNL